MPCLMASPSVGQLGTAGAGLSLSPWLLGDLPYSVSFLEPSGGSLLPASFVPWSLIYKMGQQLALCGGNPSR